MRRFYPIVLALLLLAGCSAPAPSGGAEQESAGAESTVTFFGDDLGRELTVERPRRVAALIGSFADIWCLAGGGDTLVAAANDAWTSFDLDLEGVSDLGAIKEPNLEVLLAAEPDLILASCNTAADLELLETFEAAGIPAAYFDVQDFDDYLRMLGICTALTGCSDNYHQYGVLIQAQVRDAISRQDGSAPTVLCLRATGSSCKAKGSADNVLGEMLADLGCVNIADGDGALLDDLSLEAIIRSDPDYIFAVLQGADPTDAQATLDTALLSNPAWAGLRAVEEGRFYTLDHRLYNLKPNARWGEAYEALADILYGEKTA
ncbi:MAG: ABC transporter substrate-binding protein [Oscillospiraceae bacterium]|nr:ABC transporter substrate-binding protein [Oscillospiraceae bacterium]